MFHTISIKENSGLFGEGLISITTNATNTLEFYNDMMKHYKGKQLIDPSQISILVGSNFINIGENIPFNIEEIYRQTNIRILIKKQS